jgi:thymidylate synthase|tara:strand:- start:4069 stop:4923 length:855 start_codon:yes stop_codon:yes gene_type:complete
MNFSNQFIDTIIDIEHRGDVSQPRDLKVKELQFGHIAINPIKPIADFEARGFNWKYLAGEMAWYLKKDRDVDYIGQFSGFWSNITNPDTNKINSNYGSLVFNKEQFGWAVDSLLKDKNSRQAIMFFNQPKFQFEGNKDFVCTMYANFFIRDNKLNMKIQMRSNDIFYGLTFDAPFFSFLHQSVYLILKDQYADLELGLYHHFADNIHFYERHFELAKEIKANMSSEPGHSFELKDKFIDYNAKDGIKLTPLAEEFIAKIDDTITHEPKSKRPVYKSILENYFKI